MYRCLAFFWKENSTLHLHLLGLLFMMVGEGGIGKEGRRSVFICMVIVLLVQRS